MAMINNQQTFKRIDQRFKNLLYFASLVNVMREPLKTTGMADNAF